MQSKTTLESKEAKTREQKRLEEPCVTSDTSDTAVPHEFRCSLTLVIMVDPVVAADGFTYERSAITQHLAVKLTSPRTNAPLPTRALIPNTDLRTLIQDFNANRKTLHARYRQAQLAQGTLQLLVGGRELPLQQSYINLTLLKQEAAKEPGSTPKPESKDSKDARVSEPETSAGPGSGAPRTNDPTTKAPKVEIAGVADLFKGCPPETRQQVAVLGGAGVGKSTLCRYIIHEWARRQLWPDRFQWVFRIPLRHLNKERYPEATYSEIDLIRKECLPDLLDEDVEDMAAFLSEDQHILWLLDGYDEMPEPLPPGLKAVWGQLLAKQHVVITSRPQAIAEQQWPVRLEITGFTADNVKNYITQFFAQTKPPHPELAASLQRLLDSHVNLRGISRIPIQLEILCSVWETESESFKAGTQALTWSWLYQRLVMMLVKRAFYKDTVSTAHEATILRRYSDELSALNRLAFAMMQTQQIVLPGEQFEQLLASYLTKDPCFAQCLLQLGVLKHFDVYSKQLEVATPSLLEVKASVGEAAASPDKDEKMPAVSSKRQDYYFIHLTFQEYFAARYLVECLQAPPTSSEHQAAYAFIRDRKYAAHYKLMLGFVAGLLSNQPSEKASVSLQAFWQALNAEPREFFGRRHLELIFYCLNEANLDARIPGLEDWLKQLNETGTQWMQNSEENRSFFLLSLIKANPRVFIASGMLSQTVKCLGHDSEMTYRMKALRILQALSPRWPKEKAVLPAVLELLKDKNYEVRWVVLQALQTAGPRLLDDKAALPMVLELLKDNDNVRRMALQVLEALGPRLLDDKAILPAVLKRLKDKDGGVRRMALQVLKALGPRLLDDKAILPAVLERLTDENNYVRSAALDVLRALGPRLLDDKAILPAVLERLKDKNDGVRQAALGVLQALGPRWLDDKAALPMVLELLKDKDDDVRKMALEVLVALGPRLLDDKAALPAVLERLKDENFFIINPDSVFEIDLDSAYKFSEAALGPRWWDDKAALPAVLERLKDKDDGVRRGALQVLRALGPRWLDDKTVLPAVLERLKDESGDVCSVALYVLEVLGPRLLDDKAALPMVLELLKDEDGGVRRTALQVLQALGPCLLDDKAALPAVLERLKDKDDYVRQEALEVLQALGPRWLDDKAALPMVLELLKDEDGGVRQTALQVLQALGPRLLDDKAALPAVLERLKDKNDGVRSAALGVLQALGPRWLGDKAILPAVLERLKDEGRYGVRGGAFQVLEALGPRWLDDKAILPMVLEFLKDKDKDVRRAALQVLRTIGPRLLEDKAALLMVLEQLKDKEDDVRRAALQVLRTIGPRWLDDKAALLMVLELLKDKNWDVRQAAVEVLRTTPMLPALQHLTRLDHSAAFYQVLAQGAFLQNTSFYVDDQALWLVEQRGITRVDLPWEQVQNQVQQLLIACHELAQEQNLSYFASTTLVSVSEASPSGLGLSASDPVPMVDDEKGGEPCEAKRSDLPGGLAGPLTFFKSPSRKRPREEESAAASNNVSGSGSGAGPGPSVDSGAGIQHIALMDTSADPVAAGSSNQSAAANANGEPLAKKRRV